MLELLKRRLQGRDDSEHEQAGLRIVIVGLVLGYMAMFHGVPSSWTTLDWTINDGLKEIPIEERNQDEVRYVVGKSKVSGKLDEVLICPETTQASNYGFDVTPARLVTALITERGVCDASEEGLLSLFPEERK